jgi:hypothetical protein
LPQTILKLKYDTEYKRASTLPEIWAAGAEARHELFGFGTRFYPLETVSQLFDGSGTGASGSPSHPPFFPVLEERKNHLSPSRRVNLLRSPPRVAWPRALAERPAPPFC